MRYLAIVLMLTGCAGSSAGLLERPVKYSFESNKQPLLLTSCIATNLQGNPSQTLIADNHYMIVRVNNYQMPLVRYDVFLHDGKTIVEIRSNPNMGALGLEKVEACL